MAVFRLRLFSGRDGLWAGELCCSLPIGSTILEDGGAVRSQAKMSKLADWRLPNPWGGGQSADGDVAAISSERVSSCVVFFFVFLNPTRQRGKCKKSLADASGYQKSGLNDIELY